MNFTVHEVLNGPAGVASRIEPEDTPPQVWATVARWHLRCPGQSVAWDQYVLSAVHLREGDGLPPPVLLSPGVTHEVLLLALDPAALPTTDPHTWTFLRPLNLHEQLRLPDDAAAAELVRQCALLVVNGTLWAEPPLSGQVEPWREILRVLTKEMGARR